MSMSVGGLLKHIPCPNGDACTAYRCLFRHAKDGIDSTSSSAADPSQTLESTTSSLLNSKVPATPRTVHDEASPRQHASPHGPQERATPDRPRPAERTRVMSGVGAAKTDAGHEPIRESPPDLDHQKPSSGAAVAVSVSSTRPLKRPRVQLNQTDNDATIPETPRAPEETPDAAIAAPPAKPTAEGSKPDRRHTETLNPRYLRSAPAKHEIRLRLLKMLHKHFKRLNDELRAHCTADEKATLVLSEQGLIVLALDLEESYAVSKSSSVYADAMKHRVAAYMRMKVDQWKEERTEYILQQQGEKRKRNSAVAISASAAGGQTKRDSNGSVPTAPQIVHPGLDVSPAQEIELLKSHFLTPIDKLAAFGYVPTVPSAADIQAARDAAAIDGGWEVCTECSTRFQVFPGRREEDGALASRGPCRHHPSRYDNYNNTYSCCGMTSGELGCTENESHHFKVKDMKRLAALWNFVETPANPNAPADRAVCFDCEMGYTVYGMEVVRLTATDWRSGRVLLDVLVRPMGEIIDLNSQYSGVWPKDMAEALPYPAADVDGSADAPATEKRPGNGGDDTSGSNTDVKADATGGDGTDNSNGDAKSERPPLQIVPSPQAARELFFSLISPETPLIGHALENDLNVMRIVHPTLVDTALLFPHPKGLPYRRSLKSLVSAFLGREIQQKATTGGKVQGHDSAEDARAAGDLVRYKMTQKWSSICPN